MSRPRLSYANVMATKVRKSVLTGRVIKESSLGTCSVVSDG